jgi:hypothetical protein
MTTDAHRCRVCGKTSDDDEDMVRTGARRWKHFRCLRLIGVDAILKTVSVHECKRLDQATLAALDLQTVAVGLLSTRDWPTRSAPATRCSAISRALGEETEKADTMGPSASTSAKRRPSRAGAPHDARPVSRTSRSAALRDASRRRQRPFVPIWLSDSGSQAEAVLSHARAAYTERVVRRTNAAKADTARGRLEAVLRAYLPDGSSRPAGCLIARSCAEIAELSAEGQAAALAGARREREILAECLRAGVAAGELAEDADIDAMAWHYLAVLQAVLNFPQAGADRSMIEVAMSAWPIANARPAVGAQPVR